MRNALREWPVGLAAMALILVTGCPQQPPARSAPAQDPKASAAPPAGTTPGHLEVAGKWGCLYESPGGIFWLGLEPGAQPIQVLAVAGEDNAVEGYAISADGGRLAVVTGSWTSEIIELQTGARTPVWKGERNPGPMAWSFDSSTLAYVQGGVMSLLPHGGPARVLVSDQRVSALAWSPDGSQIAYGRRDGKDQDLGVFVIPVAGGKPRHVAMGTGEIYGAADIAWSPDGKWLAFMHAWEGGALCFVKADGSAYRPDLIPAFGDVKWLPDSSAIVFVAFEDEMETRGIYRCSPMGKPEPIVKGKATDFDMLPTGRLLVVSNAPGAGKGPVGLKILPTPRATAPPEWRYDIPGTAVTGRFQPGGEHVALWVQNALGGESLWMGVAGQTPTKRAAEIGRLMGWALGPQ